MTTLDNLPQADPLDGSEMVPVLQGGVWKIAQLARVLDVTPLVFTADPTAFTATPISDTEIDLTWAGAGDFILERSPDESSWEQIYAGATASFNDSLLYGDNQYWYRLSAQDTGELVSNWVYADATTLSPP